MARELHRIPTNPPDSQARPMGWTFDIRTALFLGAFLTLLIGVLLFLVRRSVATSLQPSLRWWITGTVLYPLGFTLIRLHGARAAHLQRQPATARAPVRDRPAGAGGRELFQSRASGHAGAHRLGL